MTTFGHRVTCIDRKVEDRTYRQGSTLGDDYRHWFRAKFGNGRFRLFFLYDSMAKVIIFAWVNDETTLRTYGAKTDAYKVFKGSWTAVIRLTIG